MLATAFSNVGADNLAEKFLSLGLKVVRVGKPSGVSESLWGFTLDAAIQRDPLAQRALEDAARMTAKLNIGKGSDTKKSNKGSITAERSKRDAATEAVKASIQVRQVHFIHIFRDMIILADMILFGRFRRATLQPLGLFAKQM